MTDGPELELIRRLRPGTSEPDRALVRRERNALMHLIDRSHETDQNHGPAPAPSRRRRRARWTVPGLVLTLGATTAAGWAVLARDADDAVSFACATSDGNVTSVLPNNGTSPVEACAAEWASGAMVTGVTTAPPLVACVNGGGAVTVIDGGAGSCELAGMSPWEDLAEFEAVGRAVRDARIALFDRAEATGDACAEEWAWRDLLAEGLAAQGADGWAIEADQIAADRTCYDVGEIRPGERTVVLVGVPGDHSIGCDPRTGC